MAMSEQDKVAPRSGSEAKQAAHHRWSNLTGRFVCEQCDLVFDPSRGPLQECTKAPGGPVPRAVEKPTMIDLKGLKMFEVKAPLESPPRPGFYDLLLDNMAKLGPIERHHPFARSTPHPRGFIEIRDEPGKRVVVRADKIVFMEESGDWVLVRVENCADVLRVRMPFPNFVRLVTEALR